MNEQEVEKAINQITDLLEKNIEITNRLVKIVNDITIRLNALDGIKMVGGKNVLEKKD